MATVMCCLCVGGLGGECGVPYERYLPSPRSPWPPSQQQQQDEEDEPWYSLSVGPAHFLALSTEHRTNQPTNGHTAARPPASYLLLQSDLFCLSA